MTTMSFIYILDMVFNHFQNCMLWHRFFAVFFSCIESVFEKAFCGMIYLKVRFLTWRLETYTYLILMYLDSIDFVILPIII